MKVTKKSRVDYVSFNRVLSVGKEIGLSDTSCGVLGRYLVEGNSFLKESDDNVEMYKAAKRELWELDNKSIDRLQAVFHYFARSV